MISIVQKRPQILSPYKEQDESRELNSLSLSPSLYKIK